MKLIGYKKLKSKKNDKAYCVAIILRDITEREKNYGAVGQTCDEVFMPEEQINYLTPEMVGKDVKLHYDYLGGRPYLEKVEIIDKLKG